LHKRAIEIRKGKKLLEQQPCLELAEVELYTGGRRAEGGKYGNDAGRRWQQRRRRGRQGRPLGEDSNRAALGDDGTTQLLARTATERSSWRGRPLGEDTNGAAQLSARTATAHTEALGVGKTFVGYDGPCHLCSP